MYPDRKLFGFTRATLDVLLIAAAFVIAGFVTWPYQNVLRTKHGILMVISVEAIWLLSAQATHIYQDFRSRDFLYEIVGLLKNSLALFIGTIVVLFFIKESSLSRSFVVLFVTLTVISLSFEKYVSRRFLKYVWRRKRNLRRVVIVGAGRMGMQFAETVRRYPEFGYDVLGFLDDKKKDFLDGKYLGKTDFIEAFLRTRRVDDVVVALPNQAHRKIEEIVKLCKNTTSRVRIIPDLKGLGLGSYELATFGGLPVVSFRNNSVNETHWRIIKRSFDIVFAVSVSIVLFSWLWPIIIVLQKLFNRGTVFYRAKRWGRNGKEFTCYKFRSMSQNSENVDSHGNHQFTKKGDERITKFGSILRRTNLDELPQFINVIKGEMSIVGPRPHDSAENAKLKEVVDSYMWRHAVKPGITGWAQVNGLRGGTEKLELMRKRTMYDVWYIENWSFWLDLQIILKTIWLTMKGDPHAY